MAKDLSKMMRAIRLPVADPVHVEGSTVIATPAPREPGIYLRADGKVLRIEQMNPHHRAAAAAKARRSGDHALADELEGKT